MNARSIGSTTSFAALVAAALFIAAPVAVAQDPQPPSASAEWHVIEVETIDARQLHDLLTRMFIEEVDNSEFWSYPVPGRNAIMIRASTRLIAESDRVIRELDQQSARSEGELTEFIACKHRRASELVRLSERVISDRLNVAFDDQRNVIIAKGQARHLAELKAIVSQLDVKTESWTVELHVLGPAGTAPSGSTLEPVLAELTELGLEGYGVVSHSMVRTRGDQEFEIMESNAARSIRTRGTLTAKPDSAQANLELQVEIELPDHGSVAFRSQLRLAVGKRAIIGIAPTGDQGDKPLVLVLRVRRN